MKWIKDTYRIATRDGSGMAVKGYIAGGEPWGVHLADDMSWVIDHLPSGMRLGNGFGTHGLAKEAVERIVATGEDFTRPKISKRKLGVLRSKVYEYDR